MTVRATWNRYFLGVTILAFADHSYEIDLGSRHRPPLLVIGWNRWRPNYVHFPRRRSSRSSYETPR